MSIRILLVDDHQIVREGLRALLELEHDLTVVGEAANGRQAVELAGRLQPDVVVMDVAMPELDGIEATRRTKEAAPQAKVIALSMHSDRRFVTRALAAGVSGYLRKGCAFEDLAQAVRCVHQGRVYVSEEIAEVLAADYGHGPTGLEPSMRPHLTARERDVLGLLTAGNSTRQIATALGVSPKTVLVHRRNLMRKLGVRSVAELVKYAIRHGLTVLES